MSIYAYPSTELDSTGEMYQQHFGMTLRDYFAAKALQGLMANPNVVVKHNGTGWALCNCKPEDIADFCNAQADAMLSERAK